MTRALIFGVGSFASPAEPHDAENDFSEPQSFPPLPSVVPAVEDLAKEISHLPSLELLHGQAICNPTAEVLHKSWRDALITGHEAPLILHFAGHGEKLSSKTTLYLPGSDSTKTTLALDAPDANAWIDQAENLPAGGPVLFLLDVCGAGRTTAYQIAQRVENKTRNAWVIASCSEDEQSFGARFSQATRNVVRELRGGWLDLSPLIEHVPIETLAAAIDRELAQICIADNAYRQTVMRTSWTEASIEHPKFFPNPAYRDTPSGRFLQNLEANLRQFAEAADPTLDIHHFVSRATGAPYQQNTLNQCFFSGRSDQLRRIREWLEEDPSSDNSLLVITGSPGAGKSALLGVIVCLAHEGLSAISGQIAPAINKEQRPDIIPDLAAVHARQRTPEEVLSSIARQLGLEGLVDGEWTTEAILEKLGSRSITATVVLDALDEATRAEELLETVLIPLATANRLNEQGTEVPLFRVMIGSRPWWDRFPQLKEASVDHGTLLDLDETDADTLRLDLSSYIYEILTTAPSYQGAALRSLRQEVADQVAGDLASASHRGGFLFASLFTHHLVQLKTAVTAEQASELLPTDLPGMLELQFSRSDIAASELRPILAAIAHSFGQGMPLEIVHTLADTFHHRISPESEEKITLEDVKQAISHASFYLRTNTEEDGRQLYRFFHQSLNDHFVAHVRPDESGSFGAQDHHQIVLDRLLGIIPRIRSGQFTERAATSQRAWDAAPKYLLRHAVDHALAANNIDLLLCDSEFLVHANADTLLPNLDRAESAEAERRALIYRTSAPRHRHASAHVRRQLLLLDATRWGDQALAEDLKVALTDDVASPAAVAEWSTSGMVNPFLRQTFVGHTDFPSSATLAERNGEPVILSSDEDGSIRLWNVGSGEEIDCIPTPSRNITALAVDRTDDCSIVAAGHVDGDITVWDLDSRKPLHTIAAHNSWINSLSFGRVRDQLMLISGSQDRIAHVWEMQKGSRAFTLEGHDEYVHRVSLGESAGRPVAFTTSGDRTVRVWDLEFQKSDVTDALHDGEVSALAIVGDSTRTMLHASVGDDGQLHVSHEGVIKRRASSAGAGTVALGYYDERAVVAHVEDPQNVTLRYCDSLTDALLSHRHDSTVIALSILDLDGVTSVAVGGIDGSATLIDVRCAKEIACLPPKSNATRGNRARAMAFGLYRGTPVVAVGSRTGSVTVTEVFTGTRIRQFRGNGFPVRSIAILEVGSSCYVTAGGDDYSTRVWDISRNGIKHLLQGHTDMVTCVAMTHSSAGILVASGSDDQTVRVWNLNQLPNIHKVHAMGVEISSVQFAPGTDAPFIYAGDVQGRVSFVDTRSGDTSWCHPSNDEDQLPVISTARGRPVVTYSDTDCSVEVADVLTGDILYALPGHSRSVVSLTPGEVRGVPVVVSGDLSGTLKCWDLSAGRCISTLEDFEDAVNVLAIGNSRGKAMAVTARDDCSLRLWDLEVKSALQSADSHKDLVLSVDSRTLFGESLCVTGGQDEHIRVWDQSSGKHIVALRAFSRPTSAVCLGDLGASPIVIAAGRDETIRVWQLDGRVRESLVGHEGAIRSLSFGHLLGVPVAVSSGDDGSIRVWDLVEGSEMQTLVSVSGGVSAAAMTEVDGKPLIAAHEDAAITLWDVTNNCELWRISLKERGGRRIFFSRIGRTPVVVADDGVGCVHAWKVRDGSSLRKLTPKQGYRHLIALGEKQGRVSAALANSEGSVAFWDIAKKERFGEPVELPHRASDGVLFDSGFVLAFGREVGFFSWGKR
ncbi:hypothetical protein [Streptomyces olivaceus]|uniref:hypothetical protein n=1 Tax=Streptomyces olivaceus TaxID=47716 RepID=UPI0040562EE2